MYRVKVENIPKKQDIRNKKKLIEQIRTEEHNEKETILSSTKWLGEFNGKIKICIDSLERNSQNEKK